MLKKLKSILNGSELSNYIVTFGVEFLIMIVGVLLFKLVSLKYGTIAFSEFTINKRLLGFLVPFLMMGMGVGLPKFLPTENKKNKLELYYVAFIILSAIFCLTALIGICFSSFFSKLFFGDVEHKKMFLVILLYAYSLLLHACIYNYFRGNFDFKKSSLIQFINLAALPLILYFLSSTINQYFLFLSISGILIIIITSVIQIPLIKLNKEVFVYHGKKLLGYGIQRVPGDITLGLFLALPAFIAANYFSITEAGNIAFCISLFNIIIAFMSPINIILLPMASKIIFDGNLTRLKSIVNKLLLLSLTFGIALQLTIYFFGKKILLLFNISNEQETLTYLIIVFGGIIGYSVFSLIRSVIDAYYTKARISFIIVVSFLLYLLALFIISWLHEFSIKNILILFAISINALGLFTFLSLNRLKKEI